VQITTSNGFGQTRHRSGRQVFPRRALGHQKTEDAEYHPSSINRKEVLHHPWADHRIRLDLQASSSVPAPTIGEKTRMLVRRYPLIPVPSMSGSQWEVATGIPVRFTSNRSRFRKRVNAGRSAARLRRLLVRAVPWPVPRRAKKLQSLVIVDCVC
jgi:hypothetical protein